MQFSVYPDPDNSGCDRVGSLTLPQHGQQQQHEEQQQPPASSQASSKGVSLMAPNPINSFDLTSAANIIAKEGFQDAKPSNLLVGLLQQKVSNLQIPDNLRVLMMMLLI